MRYFLGIDGGGSHCEAVVVDESFRVLGRGQSGAGNHYAVGAEAAARHCGEAAQCAIEVARDDSDFRNAAISAWGLGLAGVRRENDAAKMRAALEKVLGNCAFVLDHDAAAAHSGAFAGGAGILLSAGTGAIAFGIDENGERFFADGWGPILGDEGGGYWIGQEALKAICRAQDGRGPRTRLSKRVLETLNVADCDALVQRIYAPETRREEIAQVAQIVFQMADKNDATALEIRERAVAHLVNSVVSVAKTMTTQIRERVALNQAAFGRAVSERSVVDESAPEIAVTLRGGLFGDDGLRAAVGYGIGVGLRALQHERWPISQWKIVRPQYEAAVGAALLARKFVEK